MIRRFRFLFILVPVAFITGAAFATMGLWNWLMPSLFGFGSLTFLKALGVFALVRLLFGARGWGGGWHHRRLAWATYGGRGRSNDAEWQQRMQDRWQNMSSEQKERFRSRCGSRFHFEEPKQSSSTEN